MFCKNYSSCTLIEKPVNLIARRLSVRASEQILKFTTQFQYYYRGAHVGLSSA